MKNVMFREKEKELQVSELCGEILANSRNELYLKMRFLSEALYALRYRSSTEICPVGTDGENLFFAPDELIELFRTDRILVNRAYMHILMHCLFCHPFLETRKKETEEEKPPADLWDLSCDIAVEYMLDDLYLPCIHVRKTHLRLSVYQDLEKALKVVTAQGVLHWLSGGVPFRMEELQEDFRVDDHRFWERIHSPQRQFPMQNRWEDIRKKMQTEMETFAKEASQDSRTLYDQLKVENRRRYDYRAFLRKFSVLREETEIDPDSFDYIFYHYGLQMYGNMPLIEPQETRETMRIEEFVIVIDTSMSCKPQLVQRFLEETYSILTQQETYARRFHIRLIQCDERVQRDMLITCQEELRAYIEDFTVEGRGGTDFRPAFAYVSGLVKAGVFRHLRGLLYFTDGLGIYPVKKPVYETAFLFMKDDYSDVDVPPWAIKIILDPLEWEGSDQIVEYQTGKRRNHRYHTVLSFEG